MQVPTWKLAVVEDGLWLVRVINGERGNEACRFTKEVLNRKTTATRIRGLFAFTTASAIIANGEKRSYYTL